LKAILPAWARRNQDCSFAGHRTLAWPFLSLWSVLGMPRSVISCSWLPKIPRINDLSTRYSYTSTWNGNPWEATWIVCSAGFHFKTATEADVYNLKTRKVLAYSRA
jgi:hypothetical protein